MKKGEAKVDIGISQKNREAVANNLNRLLSNEFLLYTKVLKFHWNVVGHQFHDFHKFFEDIYEQQLQICDDIAERARALGSHALGSMTDFLKYATLKEKSSYNLSDSQMIAELLDDHETIIKEIRKDLEFALQHGDAGTNNFLTEILMKQEKTAWMLRSHLQK